MALDDAEAIGEGEAGGGGIDVLAEAGEGADRPQVAAFGLPENVTRLLRALQEVGLVNAIGAVLPGAPW